MRAACIAGAEHPADDHLAGDRDGVEHERDEHEQLERDLMRAERCVTDPREHGRRDEERRVERSRPHEDLAADSQHRLHLAQARPTRLCVRPQ